MRYLWPGVCSEWLCLLPKSIHCCLIACRIRADPTVWPSLSCPHLTDFSQLLQECDSRAKYMPSSDQFLTTPLRVWLLSQIRALTLPFSFPGSLWCTLTLSPSLPSVPMFLTFPFLTGPLWMCGSESAFLLLFCGTAPLVSFLDSLLVSLALCWDESMALLCPLLFTSVPLQFVFCSTGHLATCLSLYDSDT